MRKSLQLSLIAVLAALHVVLYFVSFGLWRNWGIYLEAIEGIILGPRIGFLAAFFGSSIARFVKPDPLWMFGIFAEPLSVLMAGFLAWAKWKLVSASYVIMLSAYFISPYGRTLPIWTILDILFAFFLIYPTAKVSHHLAGTDVQRLSLALVLVSFICIATDSLVRVFLLVPCGLYAPLGVSREVFIGGAVSSYLEDGIVVLISLIAGVPVLISALKMKIIEDLSR